MSQRVFAARKRLVQFLPAAIVLLLALDVLYFQVGIGMVQQTCDAMAGHAESLHHELAYRLVNGAM